MLDDVNELPRAEPRTWTRRGDRRSDLRQVLEALAHAIRLPPEERNLPGLFERELRRVLSVRTVRLREVPARYQARLVTPTRTPESIVLNVPTSEPGRQAVLEAAVEPGGRMDEWNVDLLRAAAHLGALVLEAERHRAQVGSGRRLDGAAPLIGSTSLMHDLRERVERVAVTDFTVLIEGESGTGKELVARQIHELSWRRRGPFVAVNCAALVETLIEAELFGIEERTATGVRGRRGKFEHADGGTLFLDEVSDLSMSAQAKLLRAIQEVAVERVGGNGARRVDVRIVAASNRALAGLVAQGLFRADLFYRLSGVEIHVPALRSRPDDVLELARYFLGRHRHAGQLTFSDAAADALRLYRWPGNVRELERLIERTVALAETSRIELDDLPPQVRGDYAQVIEPSISRTETMRVWGSRYAHLVFERCGRNKRRACRVLGISYHTLNAYLRYASGKRGPARKQLPAWVTASMPATDAEQQKE
jgi:transcriptional regulator with PAS, ATPase and Fis domain